MATFGVYANGVNWDWDGLKEVWLTAERLGYDNVWMMDNIVGPGAGILTEENRVARGPFSVKDAVYETYTVLAAMSQLTSRIRFGPLVTPAGRRHPALLAKMTSVLDVISGGRLDFAMGPGDESRHFSSWGMPFPDAKTRVAKLGEELEIISRMWTEDDVSFAGDFYRLDHAVMYPKPVQKPHPPIWIGLIWGKRLMPKLAARYADGINVFRADDDGVREILDTVRKNCDEIGRDFDAIRKSRHVVVTFTDNDRDRGRVIRARAERYGLAEADLRTYYDEYITLILGPAAACVDQFRRQIAMGWEHFVVSFEAPDDPVFGRVDSFLESMEVMAKEVVPALRSGSVQVSTRV